MEKSCGTYKSHPVMLECGAVEITPLGWEELLICYEHYQKLQEKGMDAAKESYTNIANVIQSHIKIEQPENYIRSLHVRDLGMLIRSFLEISSLGKDEQKN